MEKILFKILDVSISIGVSLFMIGFFMKKINERDNYIKSLIEEMQAISQNFVKIQERMIIQLKNIEKSVSGIQEDLDDIKETVKVLEIQNEKK